MGSVVADVAAEKAAWRARVLKGRAARAESLAEASARIVARARALPEVAEAGTVHLFWPLPGEVDLRPLAEALHAEGRTVVLPAVAGPRALAHRRFRGADALVAGPFGVQEPGPEAGAIAPSAIDVVLVPGLGFGRDGSRLGWGGGYYDAFLGETDAARVGVAPSWAVVEAVPTAPHDARMRAVVTERGVIWTA